MSFYEHELTLVPPDFIHPDTHARALTRLYAQEIADRYERENVEIGRNSDD